MAKLQNTLSRWLQQTHERIVERKHGEPIILAFYRVVWRGENPRPLHGSAREQSRNRRRLLRGHGTPGAVGIIVNHHFVPDRLAAVADAYNEEHPKHYVLGRKAA